MPGFPWINSPRFFYFIIGIYLFFGLLNLSYIPIPWLDEAANLDPALEWHKHGVYASKAWATPGADKQFLSYPPLLILVHILNLYIVPAKVFWVRLPFLLIHISAIIILFRLLTKYIGISTLFATILCSFFLFDKAVFEISRALRAEIIEIYLLGILSILFLKKSRALFIGFIAGLLLITHLKEWPIVFIFSIYYLLWHSTKWQRLEYIIFLFTPIIIFLGFIQFNITELYSQMFVYSSEHAAKGNIIIRIYNHFLGRFFPVYKEQPWMPVIHLGITIIALRQLIKDYRKHIFAGIFIGTSLIWLVILSPNYRYWIPLYYIGILVLAEWLYFLNFNPNKLLKWYSIPVLILLLFPFLSRHLLGFTQRSERNSEKAIAFINSHVNTSEKTLLFGEEIGLYASATHQNMDCGHVIEPDNFHFKDYKYVYYLTHDSVPNIPLIATYQPPAITLPAWLYKLGKAGTFSGMKIYIVPSENDWNKITKRYYPVQIR